MDGWPSLSDWDVEAKQSPRMLRWPDIDSAVEIRHVSFLTLVR
jgi:hypothetical protein